MTDPTDPDVERFSEADVEAVAEAIWNADVAPEGLDSIEQSRFDARAALTAYTGRLAEERRVLREALVLAQFGDSTGQSRGALVDNRSAQIQVASCATTAARWPSHTGVPVVMGPNPVAPSTIHAAGSPSSKAHSVPG